MKQLTSELAKTQTQLHSAEKKCEEAEEAAKQLEQLEQDHAAALQKVKVRLVTILQVYLALDMSICAAFRQEHLCSAVLSRVSHHTCQDHH